MWSVSRVACCNTISVVVQSRHSIVNNKGSPSRHAWSHNKSHANVQHIGMTEIHLLGPNVNVLLCRRRRQLCTIRVYLFSFTISTYFTPSRCHLPLPRMPLSTYRCYQCIASWGALSFFFPALFWECIGAHAPIRPMSKPCHRGPISLYIISRPPTAYYVPLSLSCASSLVLSFLLPTATCVISSTHWASCVWNTTCPKH